MNYKTLMFSFMLIVLIGLGAFLACVSVNRLNMSGPNAKREYGLTSKIAKESALRLETHFTLQTLTLPNAKRENF